MKTLQSSIWKSVMIVTIYLLLMIGAFILADRYFDKDALQLFVSNTGAIGILVFLFISYAWVILVPGYNTPIHVASGYIFGSEFGWVLNFIATTAGLFTIIWLVKKFGRPLLEKLIKSSTLEKYDSIIVRIGPIALFVMYVLPLFPDDEITYLLAASPKVAFNRFILPILLGTFAKTSVSYFGDVGSIGILHIITVRSAILIVGLLIISFQERRFFTLTPWL